MHPSLKAASKGRKQQTVLKRIERLKTMQDKEKWQEGDDVYHLPKLKTIRIKIKKEKAEKAVEAGAATEAAAPGAKAAAAPAGAKAAAPAKEEKKEKK
jgi:small basic protein (TIGR04137 family)